MTVSPGTQGPPEVENVAQIGSMAFGFGGFGRSGAYWGESLDPGAIESSRRRRKGL